MPDFAVRLHIQPVLGPAGMSWGTIAHIKVIKEELGVGLAVAKEYVDRCVFGGETVVIPVDTLERAQRLCDRLLHDLPPTTTAEVLVMHAREDD